MTGFEDRIHAASLRTMWTLPASQKRSGNRPSQLATGAHGAIRSRREGIGRILGARRYRATGMASNSLLKNLVMENCETFFRLVRRDEGVERASRPRSNEARREKGRTPQGRSKTLPAKPPIPQLKVEQDFSV